MRDQFVGDIGDYGKIALLRHLAKGRRLGVCWYKTNDPREKNNDGKHTTYLNEPDRFRFLDPFVFDELKKIVNTPHRSIAAVEMSGLLRDAIFHDVEVPGKSSRPSWTETLKAKITNCDLVFLDPDNGIEGSRLTPKHVAVSELSALRDKNRVLVVYHHQGRRQAHAEADMLRRKVTNAGWSPVELVRFRLFSSRFYVIAGHDSGMRRRIGDFVSKWGEQRIEHFPVSG
jgi:hypothetical protein